MPPKKLKPLPPQVPKTPAPGTPAPSGPALAAAPTPAPSGASPSGTPYNPSDQTYNDGNKEWASVAAWAASGALAKASKSAARGAVPQRFSAKTTALLVLRQLGGDTALEVVGVLATNSPEKDKVGHVAVTFKGTSITLSDLFVKHNFKWKMDRSERNRPDVVSASRILSAFWWYWIEAMGHEKAPLDISGRIGYNDIPGSCKGFVIHITGILQKKEMCGLVDPMYQKEVLFIHFMHHFQITANKTKNTPFATGIMESCFAQKPACDSGSSSATAIRHAIPENLHQFIKFQDEESAGGVNPNDAIIDNWFAEYNSGNRLTWEPSKPDSSAKISFKEKLALQMLA